MKNKTITLVSITTILIINCCNKKPAVVPVNYTVKYEVSGTVKNAEITYYDIPNEGKTATKKYASNTGGWSTLPWSTTLSATGYHKAPYNIKADYNSSSSVGWLFVKVFQNDSLIRIDSAQGAGQVIELSGNLPQ